MARAGYQGRPDAGLPIAAPWRDASRLTAERIAAVRLLLESGHNIAAHDIVLATVFEHLEGGPKTTDEIASYVRQCWPGASVPKHVIVASLEQACARGIVAAAQQLGATESWRLADAGRRELEAANGWGADIVGRLETAVRDEAEDRLGTASEADARRWSQILLDVLFEGIRRSFTESPRGIRIVAGRVLFPETYDIDSMLEALERQCDDGDVRRFLESMLTAAIDPAHDFGTELVHHIATGYVLYAFVGRHDNTAARETAGSLVGETAILDTPCLVRLLGSVRATTPMLEAISHAREVGMNVIVHRATVTEFEQLLRSKTALARALEDELARGLIEPAAIDTGDAILRAWLDVELPNDRTYLTWDEFVRTGRRALHTLNALGVRFVDTVTSNGAHRERRGRLADALQAQIDYRGSRWRPPESISHDTHLLVDAAAARAANPANEAKAWPGAVVITSDTHLNDTYAEVFGAPDFPVALTPGQWASMLAGCGDPVRIERLARAISTETSQETILRRAAAIPVETTLEIARSLTGTSPSRVDLHEMQLSLNDVLAAQPDILDDEGATFLAQRALAQRNRRLLNACGQHRAAGDEERARMRIEAEANRRTREQLIRAQREYGDRALRAEERLEAERRSFRRRHVSTLLGVGLAAVLFVLAASQAIEPAGIVLGGCGLVIYAVVAYEFCTNPRRRTWRTLVGVVTAVTLVVAREALDALQ